MIKISTQLVRQLIDTQFPKWKELEIYPVSQSGHDNRTFHLGKNMIIRLPSDHKYAAQIDKEARWLPFLAKHLSMPISCPIALGNATDDYPLPWSINYYVEGKTLSQENNFNMENLAKDLAMFLKQLQTIDTKDAPIAGKHNFFRGANPIVYNDEVQIALQERNNDLPIQKLKIIWERAIASKWQYPPVWIHGDIAPGNLLINNGRLCGVIDFGIMGIGDPACDYAMAWTFFDKNSRKYFLQDLDTDTIDRARGWALWKALITYHATDPFVSDNARYTLNAILNEYDNMTTEE